MSALKIIGSIIFFLLGTLSFLLLAKLLSNYLMYRMVLPKGSRPLGKFTRLWVWFSMRPWERLWTQVHLWIMMRPWTHMFIQLGTWFWFRLRAWLMTHQWVRRWVWVFKKSWTQLRKWQVQQSKRMWKWLWKQMQK